MDLNRDKLDAPPEPHARMNGLASVRAQSRFAIGLPQGAPRAMPGLSVSYGATARHSPIFPFQERPA